MSTGEFQGKVFILSAPSGTGKNTLINNLLKTREDLVYSISTTTRKPRNGEFHGVNYYFISAEEFEKKIEKNEFFEWAPVLSNYYGTTTEEIERIFANKKHAILDLDVQGALQVKEKSPEVVTIFIMPPSIEILQKRLETRGSETASEIQRRLILAQVEIKEKDKYDYSIINDDLDKAVAELNQIIDNS